MKLLPVKTRTKTRRALARLRRRRMATARFTLVTLLAIGLVVSGAQTAQAVDAIYLTASSNVVNPGATVDLTASMPVAAAGTTTQTLTQTFDPTKVKLTGASDITYPQGWTLQYSTDGSTFSSTVPSNWALVQAVRATGPVVTESADNGRQVTIGTANQNLVPPTGQFVGYASRDPWTVVFDDDGRILVMPHHTAASNAMCFNRDGTKCVGWANGSGAWLSNNAILSSPHAAGSWLDTARNRWWYSTTTAGAIGCLDVTPGQLPSNCVLTGLTDGKFVEPACPTITCLASAYGANSAPTVIGNRLFYISTTGRIFCFELGATSVSACTGAGYTSGVSTAPGYDSFTEPSHLAQVAANGKLFTYAFKTSASNDGYLSCIDPLTGLLCSGWTAPTSVPTNTTEGIAEDIFIYPDSNGNFQAVCASQANTSPYVVCKTETGSSFSPSAAFTSAVHSYGITSAWSNGFQTVGSKIYLHNGDGSNQTAITCFDVAISAACSGFTSFNIYNYTVVTDPLNPACMWSIGDTGGIIKTFDAATGGSCTSTAPKVTFNVHTIVPRMGCSNSSAISNWKSFNLVSPTTSGYSTATLKVIKSDGTVAYTHPLSSGAVDLSLDSVAITGQEPTFVVEFTGLTSTGAASATVTAVGDAPELCLRATAVYPCPSGTGPVDLPNAVATVAANGSSVAGGTTTNLTSDSETITVTAPAASTCGSTLSGRAGDAGGGASGTAIPGVTVTLLDSSGNPITRNGQPVTTTTDSSGNYSFGRLFPGSYKVKFASVSGKTLVSSTTVSGATGTTAGATTSAVSCPGGGTTSTIQNGMSAVSGSTVLTRSTPTNLVANGDFTTASAASGTVYLFGTQGSTKTVNGISGPIGTISGWTVTGGSSSTYAFWNSGSGAPITPILNQTDGNNAPYVYFGNQAGAYITTTPTYNSSGWSLGPYSITPASGYGTAENPPAISQAVPTVVGTKYRLQFLQGYENYGSQPGIAALDVTGYSRSYFKVPMSVTRYTIEFVATSSQTTIKFSSWGHISSATELALDDVIINACSSAQTELASASLATAIGTDAVVNALYTVPAGASSDVSSGAWDTNQTISPLTNDVASSGATLTASSVKLCDVSEVAPNCSLTSKTVAGEGTYTVNANGTVTFDPLPSFNGTASAVTYQVSDSASNVVSSTFQATVAAPVPSSATADATSGLKGATQTVTPQANDTVASGITFVNSSVKLCAVGILPPNCTSTSLTTAAGTYSVNATSGVITFTPDASFTGVAPAMTYQVSDTSGQTVSSTYTATVTGVPATDNETSSGAWDQNQTSDLVAGDVAGYGTTLDPASVRLCTSGTTTTCTSATSLTVANVGTYTVSNGVVTFDPVPSFTGSAPAVTYVITDSLGQKATGTYTATVTAPVAPVASPEQKAVLPGGTVSFTSVTGGSTPLASGSQLQTSGGGASCLVASSNTTPTTGCVTSLTTSDGSWSINGSTGVVSFTASNSAQAGNLIPVSYRVTDVTGQTATATLTPVVPPAPTAASDASRGAQDTTQFVAVLGNDGPGSAAADLVPSSVKLCDTNQSAPNCSLTSKTVAGQGTYTVLANGVVKFVPVSGYDGTATAVPYQVSDSVGQTVSSTLQVVVVPPPFPLANVDTGTAAFGQSVTLRPWLNDAGGVVPAGETAPAPNVVASSIKLCGTGQAAPACSATTVTTDDGTYVLNTSTGEVVFTPVSGFSGTVISPVTYQITNDWSGLSGPGTATSLLMPTITPPGNPLALNDTRETAPMTAVTLSPVTNDVNGTGTLVATSIKLCDSTEIAPACTNTSVTVREGVFTVDPTTGDVTFTPNANFDPTHPAQVTYAIQDSLNLWTHATITITDPPPASPLSQASGLAYTGMNFFGGPAPFTAFVALVGGITVVAMAHKSRLKPGTSMLKLEFSPEYNKLMQTLAAEKPVLHTEAAEAILKEKVTFPVYPDGRPD